MFIGITNTIIVIKNYTTELPSLILYIATTTSLVKAVNSVLFYLVTFNSVENYIKYIF